MSTGKDEKKRGGSGFGFVLGVLLGVAVGVIIAILFAPQSGEATREKLADQTSQFRRRYDDAIVEGREAYERAKDEVRSSVKNG